MKKIETLFGFILIISNIIYNVHSFNPNKNDYDAYGVKIAMNNIILVKAQNGNNPSNFFVQFAPFDRNQSDSQCYIDFPSEIDGFIYTVAVGKRQSRLHFFFVGEVLNETSKGFVGIVTFNPSNSSLSMQERCDQSSSYSISYFTNVDHQEQLLLDVSPTGLKAYGFSNKLLFMYDINNPLTITQWNASVTWPDSTFIPYGVNIGENFGVISGFVQTVENFSVRYKPIIYLMNFQSPTDYPIIVDQYQPSSTPGTWQDALTNADATIFSSKYMMSVDINYNGDVLVGMQFINRVFLLAVNPENPSHLNFINRRTNGRSLGNGKSVRWLDNGLAAILVNTYSLEYHWENSKVHIYDIGNLGFNTSINPSLIYPNRRQILGQRMSHVLLQLATSSNGMSVLDERGNIVVITPTPAGSYSFIKDTGLTILFSEERSCPPGTYKNRSGFLNCRPCPNGFKNPENATIHCIPCSNDSFCSLGASNEIPYSMLSDVIQARAYPKSPDSTSFDEILMGTMLNTEVNQCFLVLPLFWAFILSGFIILVICVMNFLKYVVKNKAAKRTRIIMKTIFKHLDVINEGNYWIGGLASLIIFLFIIFAVIFSSHYIRRYPIEKSSGYTFICGESIYNAKFETQVQTLAIPFAAEEQDVVNLLNEQKFILNVNFVNTVVQCDTVSVQALYGLIWSTIRWLSCHNINSTLTLSIILPFQRVSVQVIIADSSTIGALRIGLYGEFDSRRRSKVQELNFLRSFSMAGRLLSDTLPVVLDLTKIINETTTINGDESEYSGIYVPTFPIDLNTLLITEDQYLGSVATSTILTILINETPFYVKNVQQPIVKKFELIFSNILFFTVLLELFGLLFILYKLLIRPILHDVLVKILVELRKMFKKE